MFDLSKKKKDNQQPQQQQLNQLYAPVLKGAGPRISSLPALRAKQQAPVKFDYTSKLTTSHTPTVTPDPQPSTLMKLGKGLTESVTGGIGYRLGAALKSGNFNKPAPLLPNYRPKTFGDKALNFVGSNLGDAGLWMAGDALLAKPLAALSKTAPITKGIGMLPKFVKPALPALGTGVRAAATFGGPINVLETGLNGDGVKGFTDRLKEAPLMGVGGAVLHGAGAGIGKGITTGLDRARFSKALRLPELKQNSIQDLQTAYKNPTTLRDVTQQQLNKTFENVPDNIGPTARTLAKQGMTPAEFLKQKELNAKTVFGGPRDLKQYGVTRSEDKALKELQDGIKVAQKFQGGNKLVGDFAGQDFTNAAAMDNIKHYTGVDLPKLLANYEKTQNVRGPLSQQERLMGRKAGVIPPLKQREGFPVSQQPLEPPSLPRTLPGKPSPLQWTNRDLVPKAELPFKDIANREVPKLPPVPSPEGTSVPMGEGVGSRVIEPKYAMSLQRFNTQLPESLPDTASHIVSRTERQAVDPNALKTTAYIKSIDNLHRFNQLDQYVEGVTGQKLAPKDKTYMLALNSRGTGTTASHILEENLVDPQGNIIGDSLKSITDKLKDANVSKEFDDYLVNKHAITRMKLGEKVYPDEMAMTPELSLAKVNELESLHPEFKELSNKLYEFQNKLSKAWLVDTGIVSPEAYGHWVINNPHYVPNNRLFSELEKPGFSGGTKRGFANQSNPSKARTTSQRKVISPMESIMEHTDQYVKVAKRNEVMQTLIKNIQKNPEEFKGWAEVIPSDSQLKEGLTADINKLLETDGIDAVVEQYNKQFDDIFSAKKQRLDLGNVVAGLVNGEKVHVRVNDPLLLDALTNLKPQAQQIVIAALGKVTKTMKNLTTGINPIFGLARNIWRDVPTAFVNSNSTNNPFKYGKDLFSAFLEVAGDKASYKSYKALGGGHAASSVSSSRNSLLESKARLLPGYAKKHPFQAALGGLERLNNTMETMPRLAEFKRIAKPGDYSSNVKAIYESNDVTTNFNKFGNWAKEVDSIFPYFNAAVQGLDKTYRVFKDNPAKAIPKAFMAITLPTILLYEINHNNPNYQQLSDYIKDGNFLLPKGDGTFIKIPKPRELGVMFGSSVERTMRKWQDDDPEAFTRFMATVKTNFMFPTRSIVAPLNDVRANKNFIGAPVVSGAVSKLSPQYQYDEKTSEPAKFIGGVLKQSPQQIDYLAKSYLGVIGQLGIPATTKNASVLGTLKKQVTADPAFSNDIMGDFYNTMDKIATNGSDATAKGSLMPADGSQYKTVFSSANTELGKIRKKIDVIQASSGDTSYKDDQIRSLQIKMLDIARSANSQYKAK